MTALPRQTLSEALIDPPTAADITQRLGELVREHCERFERATGYAVATGDEVTVDLFIRAGGRIVPFTARRGLTVDAGTPLLGYPGLADALVGVRVGNTVQVDTRFPNQFPNEVMRGRSGSYTVRVTSSARRHPVSLKDSALRARIGLGDDVASICAAVASQLTSERLVGARLEAARSALEQLCARVTLPVDGVLVDAELRLRFARAEGELLASFDIPPREIALVERVWVTNAAFRKDAASRVLSGAALAAVVKKLGLSVSDAEINDVIGCVPDAADFDAVSTLREQLLRLKALEVLVGEAICLPVEADLS